MNRGLSTVIVLTFLGMVGLYVGLYLAYQKYQLYAPQINSALNTAQSTSNEVSGVKNFLNRL